VKSLKLSTEIAAGVLMVVAVCAAVIGGPLFAPAYLAAAVLVIAGLFE
jgi:hypothetical protein